MIRVPDYAHAQRKLPFLSVRNVQVLSESGYLRWVCEVLLLSWLFLRTHLHFHPIGIRREHWQWLLCCQVLFFSSNPSFYFPDDSRFIKIGVGDSDKQGIIDKFVCLFGRLSFPDADVRCTQQFPRTTKSKRSCRLATSDVFPHTPFKVQPVPIAVS